MPGPGYTPPMDSIALLIADHNRVRGLFSRFKDAHEADDAHDPDSLQDSDASSWTDWEERMNYIAHLFEQNHTNREIWRTDRIGVGWNNVPWLEDGARPVG